MFKYLPSGSRVAAACVLALAILPGQAGAASTQWVEANATTLRYELSGAGPRTVVLLHEAAMSLESWDLVMPELGKHYRVLRYDLRGFGLSEKIVGEVHIADQIEDLRALLDALKIQGKVTLIGGALGGAVSLAFAATHPQRVQAVVALSPATGMPAASREAAVAAAAKVAGAGMRPLVGAQFDKAHPTTLRKDAQHTAWLRHMQQATDTRSLSATLRMIAMTDFSSYLPKISAPTLVVAAGLNQARTPASVEETADAIPGAAFHVLPTNYFMAAQSPELLLPLLMKFLRETESPGITR